jgi:hypothetical protein
VAQRWRRGIRIPGRHRVNQVHLCLTTRDGINYCKVLRVRQGRTDVIRWWCPVIECCRCFDAGAGSASRRLSWHVCAIVGLACVSGAAARYDDVTIATGHSQTIHNTAAHRHRNCKQQKDALMGHAISSRTHDVCRLLQIWLGTNRRHQSLASCSVGVLETGKLWAVSTYSWKIGLSNNQCPTGGGIEIAPTSLLEASSQTPCQRLVAMR